MSNCLQISCCDDLVRGEGASYTPRWCYWNVSYPLKVNGTNRCQVATRCIMHLGCIMHLDSPMWYKTGIMAECHMTP